MAYRLDAVSVRVQNVCCIVVRVVLRTDAGRSVVSSTCCQRRGVKGAAQAIEFYKKAFSATERMRISHPDGRIGHAEVQIGDSVIILSDEFPEMGGRSPQTLGWITREYPSVCLRCSTKRSQPEPRSSGQ
jgi:hypothetical protein